MASLSPSSILLLITFFASIPSTLSGTVVEDLAHLQPPHDFNSTITINCLNNPSLRYCNSSFPLNLNEIFKFTIVASHLCNESRNPNCVESFPKIDLRNHPKIAPLYLSFDFFWKYCPLTILSIDFSNNSLKGNFPISVLNCTQIHALDLSLNKLTGDFPIERFTPLTNLTFLNLSYNYFAESEITEYSKFFERFNASTFLHSGLLPSRKSYNIRAILLLVVFPLSVALIVGCIWWLCFRRPDYLPRFLQRKHKFTPPMLKAATNGFLHKNLVAKSASIHIYKGCLRDGTVVRIEMYSNDISREDRQSFVEECKVLVQLQHKNVVQILGWCSNRNNKAIVTKWTGGENVEMWLSRSAPPWKQRLKLLKELVDGMCYLQQQWPEVGYDLRTHSVLLSHNLEPLISRFKVGDPISRNKWNYMFGLFVLEIITNRRPGEAFDNGEEGFIDHIRTKHLQNLHDVIDSKMILPESMIDQAKQVLGLGLMCADLSARKHPSLNQIADTLSRIYETCQILGSHNNGKSHEGGKGHNRIQSR